MLDLRAQPRSPPPNSPAAPRPWLPRAHFRPHWIPRLPLPREHSGAADSAAGSAAAAIAGASVPGSPVADRVVGSAAMRAVDSPPAASGLAASAVGVGASACGASATSAAGAAMDAASEGADISATGIPAGCKARVRTALPPLSNNIKAKLAAAALRKIGFPACQKSRQPARHCSHRLGVWVTCVRGVRDVGGKSPALPITAARPWTISPTCSR